MLLQEADRIFEFGGELAVFAIDDRIDVFLEQYFKQRTRSAARPRAKRAGDLRRKIPQNRDDAVRIAGERFQEVPIPLGPKAGREIRPYSFRISCMAKEPTFLQGLLGSAIPLAIAAAVVAIATALVYTFWFGVGWITDWLF